MNGTLWFSFILACNSFSKTNDNNKLVPIASSQSKSIRFFQSKNLITFLLFQWALFSFCIQRCSQMNPPLDLLEEVRVKGFIFDVHLVSLCAVHLEAHSATEFLPNIQKPSWLCLFWWSKKKELNSTRLTRQRERVSTKSRNSSLTLRILFWYTSSCQMSMSKLELQTKF